VTQFDKLPSTYKDKNVYDKSILDYFRENGFKEHSKNDNVKTERRHLIKSSKSVLCDILFVNEEKEIFIRTSYDSADVGDLIKFTIVYSIQKGEIETQLDFTEIEKFKQEKKKSNISLVKKDMTGLDTEEFYLTIPDIDLELNYGKDFIKIHDLIVERLNNDDDKGIILLHGDPGTGKTSYLKYLTKFIETKDILFIPPSMAEMLTDPAIIPFLLERKNTILIIEDAERVISDRETNGSPVGVSNILNLTDGILGDCLKIQVIATFNMKRERIDQALLRKGRLICEHKFGILSVDETNILLKRLNKNVVSDKGLTLADIYNIDSEEVRVTKGSKKMGFN
jgi:ATP-dependent 26S proteasome regulatory subunit